MTESGKRWQMMIVHNEGGKAAVLDFKAKARFATAEGRRKNLVYLTIKKNLVGLSDVVP